MKKGIPIFGFLFLFVLSSCDKDDDCEEQQVLPITSLEEEYGCDNTRFAMEVELSNDYTIIRNQAEYDHLVTSDNCNPEINFLEYDLLIGKKGFNKWKFFD